MSEHLIGRKDELARLDAAWAADDVHVMSIVARAGEGKTALVRHWLGRMAAAGYRGARRVFGWSFYSQGTTDRAASADLFIDRALRFFGDSDPTRGSPYDRGERLAHLLTRERNLLILDGLEPLQYPPTGSATVRAGELKDPGLKTLLSALAAHNPGLCVITTRESVVELAYSAATVAPRIELHQLPEESGADLLARLDVVGTEGELRQASKQFGGHALALILLASYLTEVFGGDVTRADEVSLLEQAAEEGGHAHRVLRSYERWLGGETIADHSSPAPDRAQRREIEQRGKPMLAVLRLLGLFDRPTDAGCLGALRADPAIEGLTEPLVGLSDRSWSRLIIRLRKLGLVAQGESAAAESLDAHPLVREYFAEQLAKRFPAAACEAHGRLYEHLRDSTPELPDNLNKMMPLFHAVAHGCQAGRHIETLEQVYWRRIMREKKHYATKQLGAFSADLAAISYFFDIPWSRPSPILGPRKADILKWAGFPLRALGRLREAIELMQASLEDRIQRKEWRQAAKTCGHLSAISLTLGEIDLAVSHAEKGMEFDALADHRNARVLIAARAYALYHAGEISKAENLFRQAEVRQKERRPDSRFLYSVQGFRFCDLLINSGRYEEARRRAEYFLELAEKEGVILEVALGRLILGRAALSECSQIEDPDFSTATEFLDRAVDDLRRAADYRYLPLGLLARSVLRRSKARHVKAWGDLQEAYRIAKGVGMVLIEADYHLEACRLCLIEDRKDTALIHFTAAEEIVEPSGYHLRSGELKGLKVFFAADQSDEKPRDLKHITIKSI